MLNGPASFVLNASGIIQTTLTRLVQQIQGEDAWDNEPSFGGPTPRWYLGHLLWAYTRVLEELGDETGPGISWERFRHEPSTAQDVPAEPAALLLGHEIFEARERLAQWVTTHDTSAVLELFRVDFLPEPFAHGPLLAGLTMYEAFRVGELEGIARSLGIRMQDPASHDPSWHAPEDASS